MCSHNSIIFANITTKNVVFHVSTVLEKSALETLISEYNAFARITVLKRILKCIRFVKMCFENTGRLGSGNPGTCLSYLLYIVPRNKACIHNTHTHTGVFADTRFACACCANLI